MQWVGKAVGGILGYAAAGPVGSLLGILVGHQFDQGLGQRLATGSAPMESYTEVLELLSAKVQ